MIKNLMDLEAGSFYSVDNVYLLPIQDIAVNTEMDDSEVLKSSSMFDISIVKHGELRVGYAFSSKFKIVNGGGYLITYFVGKAGKAHSVEVLVKSDALLLYNFPNCGSIAISPKVNTDILTIFTEQ